MQLDLTYYERCIETLERAYNLLQSTNREHIDFHMYRSACVKEFEIIMEQSGKFMKKLLKPYLDSAGAADRMYFKDLFRNAVQRGIITPELCERFLGYRDSRNSSAHDYGAYLAYEILELLPQFIEDVKILTSVFKQIGNAIEE